MNNIIFDRINKQIKKSEKINNNNYMEEKKIEIIIPISEEKLKDLLISLFPEANTNEYTDMIIFNHVWDFSDWYLSHKEQFTENQQIALNTLVETRNMVGVGCPCKRAHREKVAMEYWRSFWINNRNNDLLPTILKISKSKQLSFANLFVYPDTQ